MAGPPDWTIVIFAARESATSLAATVAAARCAAAGASRHRVSVEVLVNGNPALADALSQALAADAAAPSGGPGGAIKVWHIPRGDKANAWNQYIHALWAGQALVFFVDGYARLLADAVALLGEAVLADAAALGGTGLPTHGPSAAALRSDFLAEGGFHGNFCCIKGEVLAQLRQRQFRLPLGLYRTDSLLGAVLCYALDPGPNVWEHTRIVVHPDASWQTDAKQWWHWRELALYLKRMLRQARGALEKAAFRDHLAIRRQPPQTLPATAREMVLEWAGRCPDAAASLLRANPLARRVLRQLAQPEPPAAGAAEPVLVWAGS